MKSDRFLTATIVMFMIFLVIGYKNWADQQFIRIDSEIATIQAELNHQIDRTDRKIEITRAQMDLIADVVFYDMPEAQESDKVSLGIFTVTAYCPCKICCGQWSNVRSPITASGATAEAGITVGADWGTIPEGTEIYIGGLGKRVVTDKPAKWIIDKYDGKILDLFFSTHSEALKFGKQQLEVWEVD